MSTFGNGPHRYDGFDRLEGRPYSYDEFADLCGEQPVGQLTGVWESHTSPLVTCRGLPDVQHVVVIDTGRFVFVRSMPRASGKLLSMRLAYPDDGWRYYVSGKLTIHDGYTRSWEWGVNFMEAIHFLYSPERQALEGRLDNKIQLRTPGDRRIPEQEWRLERRSHSLDRAILDQFIDAAE